MSVTTRLLLSCLFLAPVLSISFAQDVQKSASKKKVEREFSWVSRLGEVGEKYLPKGVKHGSYKSPSMGVDVGYYIYLPPGYDENPEKRYPVVYHLHGGRPGGEHKSVKLVKFIDQAIRDGEISPKIYVWPNGGPMSWYNYPSKKLAMGEDVFIKETIPHIDATYRTIAKRSGRGIEGFSQGGRGTTRIMFKYPELFASAAPGGSGYGPEKRIQENNGAESEYVKFEPGNNTWDLAKGYVAKEDAPDLEPLIWVGTKGFNYETNLEYMDYLKELGIPFQKIITPGARHSAHEIYEADGLKLMQYHDQRLRK